MIRTQPSTHNSAHDGPRLGIADSKVITVSWSLVDSFTHRRAVYHHRCCPGIKNIARWIPADGGDPAGRSGCSTHFCRALGCGGARNRVWKAGCWWASKGRAFQGAQHVRCPRQEVSWRVWATWRYAESSRGWGWGTLLDSRLPAPGFSDFNRHTTFPPIMLLYCS